MLLPLIAWAVAFALSSCSACSIDAPRLRPVTVLSYNVENLFDDVADGTEYAEYRPSEGGWSSELFHRKMQHIAEVLRSVRTGGADIVALEEIENERALSRLNELYLGGMGYAPVVGTTRGSSVNVALLSRFPLRAVRLHGASATSSEPLRNVLEVEVDCGGVPLVVLVNHWKSKLGDDEVTEPLRRASAAIVSRRVAELLAERPHLDIVIAGDLNECFDEYQRVGRRYLTALLPAAEARSMEQSVGRQALLLAASAADCSNGGVFFDPWCLSTADEGSTCFEGRWESIDHLMMTSTLFDEMGLAFESFEVVRRSFFVDPAGRPVPWNQRTGTGYSDHLPILLTLRFR